MGFSNKIMRDFASLLSLTKLRFCIDTEMYNKEYSKFTQTYSKHPFFFDMVAMLGDAMGDAINSTEDLGYSERKCLRFHVGTLAKSYGIRTFDELLKDNRFKKPTEILLKYYPPNDKLLDIDFGRYWFAAYEYNHQTTPEFLLQ